MVGAEGLEPSSPKGQRGYSPRRLPLPWLRPLFLFGFLCSFFRRDFFVRRRTEFLKARLVGEFGFAFRVEISGRFAEVRGVEKLLPRQRCAVVLEHFDYRVTHFWVPDFWGIGGMGTREGSIIGRVKSNGFGSGFEDFIITPFRGVHRVGIYGTYQNR